MSMFVERPARLNPDYTLANDLYYYDPKGDQDDTKFKDIGNRLIGLMTDLFTYGLKDHCPEVMKVATALNQRQLTSPALRFTAFKVICAAAHAIVSFRVKKLHERDACIYFSKEKRLDIVILALKVSNYDADHDPDGVVRSEIANQLQAIAVKLKEFRLDEYAIHLTEIVDALPTKTVQSPSIESHKILNAAAALCDVTIRTAYNQPLSGGVNHHV